ncbi:Helicase associated domain protein (plasmid) [Streptomyces sp. SDT5-1]|uniref:Helicase associated domain protein n=1 Tax=Streptomyces sp. SDT5-1 TaxID=3406418 RepID=UPI003FD5A4C8
MAVSDLREHQIEAVDAVVRALQTPADGVIPPEGLRTQAIASTGSGKTLIAIESARRLGARRVLVLVPSRDLLLQMARAWRAEGRTGAMVGVCDLPPAQSEGLPCTTDPDELAAWLGGLDVVTVFSTYKSAGMGVLQRAQAAGVGAFDLMVLDEAHRTSGDLGKSWGAVHDQAKVAAVRRLYMTATPRIWASPDDAADRAEDAAGGGERLLASMEPDSPIFGPVAYKLKLTDAIRRGIVAPYQVVCVDIRDGEVVAAREVWGAGSDEARGARLAALQTGLVTAAAEENLRKILSFHSKVIEAEAFSQGLPGAAARLWEEDPDTYHPPTRVWADWLEGGHPTSHRRAVLAEFASDAIASAEEGEPVQPAMLRVLSSVKVLGEGIDTVCDSVLFADARGSMVDIVQMVGRALRIRPGQNKVASLIVPVFLGPDEEPDELLTSDAYSTLAKVLAALRAHDSDTIELLADPRPRTGNWHNEPDDEAEDGTEPADSTEDLPDVDAPDAAPRTDGGPSAPARELLKFSTPRDPATLARFMQLRVIDPETTYWRRGIQACLQYLAETSCDELKVPYAFTTPEDWSPAGFPLGVWLADVRRTYNAGRLSRERTAQLDELCMVWDHRAAAFDEGLAVARAWTDAHGHFLPPTNASWNGYPIGSWAKNQRAAARLARQVAEQRAAGQPADTTGALSEDRLEALDDIDPGWCPAWDAGWQRCLRLLQTHLRDGGTLPTTTGELIVQGEDLGRWAAAQQRGWDQLLSAQQYLLENALGLSPATDAEQPVKRTQDDKWNLNLAAARRFQAREGHLNVPRKHTEHLPVTEAGPAATGREITPEGTVPVALGMWIANTRRRADKLSEERRAALEELNLRW